MEPKGIVEVKEHNGKWTVFVCKACGKRCLNEYNLQAHQIATGHDGASVQA